MSALVVERHHRALVVESCAIATLGAFLLAAVAKVPWWQLIGAGLLVTACASAAVFIVSQAAALHCATALWGLCLTGWEAYVARAHVLYRDGWKWLAGMALVLTVVTLYAYSRHLANDAADRRLASARVKQAELGKWAKIFEDVGLGGICAARESQERGGQAVLLTLPASGKITLSMLKSRADNLAAALRLQPGSVSFAAGAHAGQVIMHLDTVDVLAEPLPFPPGALVLSVTEPLAVGIQSDGSPLLVSLREVAAMITGATGSGKSNLLTVLIALLTMCNDTIVCVIDVGKQGRLAAPWIRPWVEGRCNHPAIEWVATTRREAWDMLTAANRIIDGRAASLIGGSKIEPTPDMPQLVIICDELADLFGMMGRQQIPAGAASNAAMAEEGSKLTRKGRSEATMPIWGVQKSTADFTGTTAIKSQCALRFLLGTTSEVDARNATDSVAASKLLAQAQHSGSVIISTPGQVSDVLGKLYRLDPADPADLARIDELAQLAGMTRPPLDDISRQAAGAAYEDRWHKSELYQRMLADFHDRTGLAPLAPPPAPRPSATAVAEVDIDAEARAIFAQLGFDAGPEDAKGRMYAMLAELSLMGMSVFEIRGGLKKAGLERDRTTIYRWLNDGIRDGKIEKIAGEGEGARYRLLHRAPE
jgi:hypothetical protein